MSERYEIRHGKFGCYYHDADTGVDLTMAAVLALLNKLARTEADHKRLLDRLAEKHFGKETATDE